MTPERYNELNRTGAAPTREEVNAGWHYCTEWDFLLIGPDMKESLVCTCYAEGKVEQPK